MRARFEAESGTSTLTLANGDPSHPGGTQPGTVDLDDVDVEPAPQPAGASSGAPVRIT